MPAKQIDLVFVIDASSSMASCFEGLCAHIGDMLIPMKQAGLPVRFGLVTHQVPSEPYPKITTLIGDHRSIYLHPGPELFTENPNVLKAAFKSVKPMSDERNLVALDCALDFPFGPLDSTIRVISLFSDEGVETGSHPEEDIRMIPTLIEKIQARGIRLYGAVPESEAFDRLAEVDGSEFEYIDAYRSDRHSSFDQVDFKALLGQMGKSISASKAQGFEKPYRRALFGQDQWL